jgi:hypothetical protein
MEYGHVKIKHLSRSQTVTVGTSTAASTSARCDDMAAGVVVVSGHTASATFTVWASPNDSSFAIVYGSDGAGSTITIPAPAAVVALPDAVFGVPFVRLTSDSALSTAASVVIGVKS